MSCSLETSRVILDNFFGIFTKILCHTHGRSHSQSLIGLGFMTKGRGVRGGSAWGLSGWVFFCFRRLFKVKKAEDG